MIAILTSIREDPSVKLFHRLALNGIRDQATVCSRAVRRMLLGEFNKRFLILIAIEPQVVNHLCLLTAILPLGIRIGVGPAITIQHAALRLDKNVTHIYKLACILAIAGALDRRFIGCIVLLDLSICGLIFIDQMGVVGAAKVVKLYIGDIVFCCSALTHLLIDHIRQVFISVIGSAVFIILNDGI